MPQGLAIRFLNVWEDKDTAKTLSEKLLAIQDKSLDERMAQIIDLQAIQNTEATGEMQAGYFMRIQRGL